MGRRTPTFKVDAACLVYSIYAFQMYIGPNTINFTFNGHWSNLITHISFTLPKYTVQPTHAMTVKNFILGLLASLGSWLGSFILLSYCYCLRTILRCSCSSRMYILYNQQVHAETPKRAKFLLQSIPYSVRIDPNKVDSKTCHSAWQDTSANNFPPTRDRQDNKTAIDKYRLPAGNLYVRNNIGVSRFQDFANWISQLS
jgi:hypothetical protein